MKIAGPSNEALLWRTKSIHELDEYYTRRVLGFESVRDLWQWMSCVELMISLYRYQSVQCVELLWQHW